MSHRELWLTVSGRREVSGHAGDSDFYGRRLWSCRPARPVNPEDVALMRAERRVAALLLARDGIAELQKSLSVAQTAVGDALAELNPRRAATRSEPD